MTDISTKEGCPEGCGYWHMKREDADLPEWDTPGTPVNPAYTSRTEDGEFTTQYFPPQLGLNNQPLPTQAQLDEQDAWLRQNWTDRWTCADCGSRTCPECGTITSREDSALCSACLFRDLPF